MLPVLVPTTRSNISHIFLGSCSSSSANIFAGKIPRTPPPSMLSTLNGLLHIFYSPHSNIFDTGYPKAEHNRFNLATRRRRLVRNKRPNAHVRSASSDGYIAIQSAQHGYLRNVRFEEKQTRDVARFRIWDSRMFSIPIWHW